MKLAILVALLAAHLSGQWLRHPTAGVPRTPDGRPDMAAQAPRTPDGTPDLSGLWRMDVSRVSADLTQGLRPEDIQPWAAALAAQRAENLLRDAPPARCLPMGPIVSYLGTPDGFKIMQTPQLIAFLYPDMTFRQIFLDGRGLESNPNPSWMGYSVGRWQEDTLIVESNGYNQQSWLDAEGHPHSENLKVTERIRRTAFGTLSVEVTFEDPEVYARPMRVSTRAIALPDTEMLEYVCAENERDRAHLIGTVHDDAVVNLPVAALSAFSGVYLLQNPGAPVAIPIEIKVEDGRLTTDHPILGRIALTPISADTFSGLGTTVWFRREGDSMTVTFRAVEGDFTAVRGK